MRRWVHRAAQSVDLPAIVALDLGCFGNPWVLDVYRQELVRSSARLRVADVEGVLSGVSCTWIMGEEAHLLRIATHTDQRRRGLGRALLGQVVHQATSAGCRRLLLEVAAGNRPAVGLYEAFGFRRIGRRKGYYARPPDDALVMERTLRSVAAVAGPR